MLDSGYAVSKTQSLQTQCTAPYVAVGVRREKQHVWACVANSWEILIAAVSGQKLPVWDKRLDKERTAFHWRPSYSLKFLPYTCCVDRKQLVLLNGRGAHFQRSLHHALTLHSTPGGRRILGSEPWSVLPREVTQLAMLWLLVSSYLSNLHIYNLIFDVTIFFFLSRSKLQ